MTIYADAMRAQPEPHLGRFLRVLTGSQNLIQTIYHEYMHYSGYPDHGSNVYSREWINWNQAETKALGGWIYDY